MANIIELILLSKNLNRCLINCIASRMLLINVLSISIWFWMVTAILLIKRMFLYCLLLLILLVNLVLHIDIALRFSKFSWVYFLLIDMIVRQFLYLFLSSLFIIILILIFLLIPISIYITILKLITFLNFGWIVLLFKCLTIIFSHRILFRTSYILNWIGSINSWMLIHINITHRHWYILSISFSVVNCCIWINLFLALIVSTFLHYLLIFTQHFIFEFTAWRKLTINLLYFIYILLYFLKINIFELPILIEIRCMLHISQYKRWDALQIKFLVTGKWKYFIWIFVMYNNKYIAVAISNYLFSFSK